MPKEYFEFKQFVIYHDKCAMKVGTDGVLLGAWTTTEQNTKRILDIGTGSGLIAIMLAQKSDADIIGVDIDDSAIQQATENAYRSTWKERLTFLKTDIKTFHTDNRFDLIVCNPPFFVNSLHCPNQQRTTARHSSSLPFETLIKCVYNLLANNGLFNVILPYTLVDEFTQLGWECGLHLYKRCIILSKSGDKPIRSILSLTKDHCDYPKTEYLVIRNKEGEYTEEYKELTKEYYLHF